MKDIMNVMDGKMNELLYDKTENLAGNLINGVGDDHGDGDDDSP